MASSFPLGFTSTSPPEISEQGTWGKLGTKPSGTILPQIQQEWGKKSTSGHHLSRIIWGLPWECCRFQNSRMLNSLFIGVWKSTPLMGWGGQTKNSHRRLWSPSINFIYDGNMELCYESPPWQKFLVLGKTLHGLQLQWRVHHARLWNTLYASFCFSNVGGYHGNQVKIHWNKLIHSVYSACNFLKA